MERPQRLLGHAVTTLFYLFFVFLLRVVQHRNSLVSQE